MTDLATRPIERFQHDAVLYSGLEDFVGQMGAFIEDAVDAEEPILVVVDAGKIDRLTARLGPKADAVRFADMADVGGNPARIIPAWRAFVDEHSSTGRPFRGIGEPIWAARTPDELVECERHEALLNLAFADSPPWWLVCPYDVTSLDGDVLAEAERNHPAVIDGGSPRASAGFRNLDEVAAPFDRPLPPPPEGARLRSFDGSSLTETRAWVRELATAHQLPPARVDDVVLAAAELLTNSVRHGGGRGTLLIWSSGDDFVFEVRDDGRLVDPLAGRRRPSDQQMSGFGLWMVTQLCDLVQVRSFDDGSVVRLHVSP